MLAAAVVLAACGSTQPRASRPENQCSVLEARAARAIYELHAAAAELDLQPDSGIQLVSGSELRALAARARAAGTAVADAGIEADRTRWHDSSARQLVVALDALAASAQAAVRQPDAESLRRVQRDRARATRLIEPFEQDSPCNEDGFPAAAPSSDR